MNALIEAGISQREACRSTSTSRASWCRWRKKAASPRGDIPTRSQRHSTARVKRCGTMHNSSRMQLGALLQQRAASDRRDAAGRRPLSGIGVDVLSRPSATMQIQERRAIATHPARVKPELLTTAPNGFGAGISPSFPGRRNGRGSASISSWTSSAGTSLTGR